MFTNAHQKQNAISQKQWGKKLIKAAEDIHHSFKLEYDYQ
jgi:hypothetical protein